MVVVAAAASGLSARFNSTTQRPRVQPVVTTQQPTPAPSVMVTSTPASSVPDVAVMTSGDLTQSVPPSWTFVDSTTAPQHVPSFSTGLQVSDQIRISSLDGSSKLRLTEYAIQDQATLDKELKGYVVQKVGKISGLLVQPAGSKAPIGLLIQGTTSAVLIANDDGSAWPTKASSLANDVNILVQSIRVQ